MAYNKVEIYQVPTSEIKSTVVNDKMKILTYSEEVIAKSEFIWRIRNFSWQELKEVKRLESEDFQIDSRDDLTLHMFIEGSKSHLKENFIVGITVKETCNPIKASYMFYILDKNFAKVNKGAMTTAFNSEGGRAALGVAPIQYIMRQFPETFMQNGDLAILCQVTTKLERENSGVIRDLDYLLRSGEYSDVVLKVKDVRFPVHRCILHARSQVLARMFEHNTIESKDNVVLIPDVDPDVIEEMLRFIYTDKVKNIDELALELLIVADKYGIDDLKVKCEDVLCNIMDVENVVALLIHADTYGSRRLKEYANKYITKNSRLIFQSKSYNNVGKEHLHLFTDIFMST